MADIQLRAKNIYNSFLGMYCIPPLSKTDQARLLSTIDRSKITTPVIAIDIPRTTKYTKALREIDGIAGTVLNYGVAFVDTSLESIPYTVPALPQDLRGVPTYLSFPVLYNVFRDLSYQPLDALVFAASVGTAGIVEQNNRNAILYPSNFSSVYDTPEDVVRVAYTDFTPNSLMLFRAADIGILPIHETALNKTTLTLLPSALVDFTSTFVFDNDVLCNKKALQAIYYYPRPNTTKNKEALYGRRQRLIDGIYALILLYQQGWVAATRIDYANKKELEEDRLRMAKRIGEIQAVSGASRFSLATPYISPIKGMKEETIAYYVGDLTEIEWRNICNRGGSKEALYKIMVQLGIEKEYPNKTVDQLCAIIGRYYESTYGTRRRFLNRARQTIVV